MKLRLALVGAVALVLSALGAPGAQAVLNGTPDGDAHPNVGMLLSDVQFSDGTWIVCSGSLIAPDVFLTAAHCAFEGDRVRITFASQYFQNADDPADPANSPTYTGTFHADPAFPGTHADPHDIAVVVLDQPVEGVQPVTLPAAGSLNKLSQGTSVLGVGYGASDVESVPGGHAFFWTDEREQAVGSLNTVTPSYLNISENTARGLGGGCYGDSGGPNFITVDGQEVQAGITLTGDRLCRAINLAYRLDTPSARDFLGQYVTLS